MGYLLPKEVRNQGTNPEEPSPAKRVAMGAKGWGAKAPGLLVTTRSC